MASNALTSGVFWLWTPVFAGFLRAKMADVPQYLPISGSNYAARSVSTQEILFAEAA
jgi:hypothetical protein